MSKTIYILIWISPVIIGGIIAALNSTGVNDSTEKVEAWTRRMHDKVSLKKGWFFNLIINPVLWLIVRFCDWTDSFEHRGLKNGVRVAATLYLLAVWCFLLYLAFMVVVMVLIVGVILYVIFKVLMGSDDTANQSYEKGRSGFQNSRSNQHDVTENIGLKGQKIYSGTNWFNEELKGRVDEDGNIYKGTNWFNEEKIGRIDTDGTIYQGTGFLNEYKVGRIDENGYLHKGTNWFNEEKTGRIDEDGNIHKGTHWFNEEKTGRTGV